MKAVIRIKGQVNVDVNIKETLNRMRLRRKYACILLNEKKELLGMLKKVKQFVVYGDIDKETLKELITKRGRKIGNKKIDTLNEEIIEKILSGKTNLKELDIKPFFRLHPPRGGFKKSTRLLFPKGILGENKNINDLIKRML